MTILLSETRQHCDRFIENTFMEAWIYEGLMFLRYKIGTIVDLKSAQRCLKDRLELCNKKAYAVVNDCKQVKYWTKEAREFQNTQMNYELYKAGAIIYSDSFVANTIINFYLKFTKILIPAKFFTNEKEAIEWILKYK